ncbi:MAG: N-acetyl-1-D-myo-inositol-2-amino-2-deoxy-alpha-D-glucopyranoside deacetylase [Mycobacterium sp.]|nr:N-acetyl-1-D-myo-inositol-2-amino-2-deoxy-alpha-D-glucopyranoside deacetylase [Mycobacterium sp.]
MATAPRLLFVHAHPDDETINNGVTIARYAALGAVVTVVTCTLGEEGEIVEPRWKQLGVEAADQLGGYRIAELTTALRHLGVDQPRFLGGAGRWRDSGMPGTPARRRAKFVDADVGVAAAELAEVIAEIRPHVVVTYDPEGGYGHPDHIHTHRVTTAAVAAASDRWEVPKFYWTVMTTSTFRAGVEALGPEDVLPDWTWPVDEIPFSFADDHITTVVDAPEHLAAKVAAIGAHATQMALGPTGRAFSLSNKVALPVLAREYYVLVSGRPGVTADNGWETDLLSGLDVGVD